MKKRIMTLMMGALLLLTACGQTRDNSTSTMLPVAAVQSAAQGVAGVADKTADKAEMPQKEEKPRTVRMRCCLSNGWIRLQMQKRKESCTRCTERAGNTRACAGGYTCFHTHAGTYTEAGRETGGTTCACAYARTYAHAEACRQRGHLLHRGGYSSRQRVRKSAVRRDHRHQYDRRRLQLLPRHGGQRGMAGGERWTGGTDRRGAG